MKFSIVVPVYNEKGTVKILLDKVLGVPLPAGLEKEVVIVEGNRCTGHKVPRRWRRADSNRRPPACKPSRDQFRMVHPRPSPS